MKQISTQKWILSSLLIAALGSQYYFSTSSKNIETIDLASRQPDAVTGAEDTAKAAATIAKILEEAPKAAVVNNTDSKPAQVPNTLLKPKTEAASAALCTDCVILTKDEAKKIRELLEKVARPAVVAEEKKSACEAEETPLEKTKCEIAERKNKKEAELLAKKELQEQKRLNQNQEKEAAQLARDDDFETKFLDSSANCRDVACYSSKMASALRRYTGQKRITEAVVTRLFKEHILKNLSEGLKDPSDETALNALETLMSEIPAEYNVIKKNSIDLAKSAAKRKADEAVAKSQQALALEKQAQTLMGNPNKLNEWSQVNASAYQARTDAEAAKNEFETMFKDHKNVMAGDATNDEFISDKATYSYYNIHYARPASEWLKNIMNGKTNLTDAGAGQPVNPNQTSQNNNGRGEVRGGNNNPTVDNKMTLPSTNNGNIQFGTQQNSRSGGRGSY